MKCNFVIGQKVVCIAKGDWSRMKREAMLMAGQTVMAPERGKVYTIRCIYTDGSEVGLRFEEIINLVHPHLHIEYGFPFWEFAPLEERKTDISIFTKMLTPELVS